MKGAQIAVNILLFLLVAVLFYFQFNLGKDNSDIEPDSVVKDNGEQTERWEVRYVNTDSIWSSYDYVEQLRAELDEKQKQYADELEHEVQKFQSNVDDFQKNMMTMSREEGQQKQQELMLKEQELQQLQEKYNLLLVEEEQKMKAKLRDKIIAFLQKFKLDNVDLILDNSESSSTLLYPDSLDITTQVITDLNEAMQEKQQSE